MNPRAEVWNVLHDGGIVHIQKLDSGDLVLTVEIPYLRRMISEGDNIILTLRRCSQFSMKIWEQDLTTANLNLIAQQGTEILSTESEDTPVLIVTTLGEIDANFDSFSLAQEDGTEITFEVLCDACERYWNRWEQESKVN
jgi:hypothetical protein